MYNRFAVKSDQPDSYLTKRKPMADDRHRLLCLPPSICNLLVGGLYSSEQTLFWPPPTRSEHLAPGSGHNLYYIFWFRPIEPIDMHAGRVG
jgi:hypothetical protein